VLDPAERLNTSVAGGENFQITLSQALQEAVIPLQFRYLTQFAAFPSNATEVAAMLKTIDEVQFSVAFSKNMALRAAMNMTEEDAEFLREQWIQLQQAYANLTDSTSTPSTLDRADILRQIDTADLFTQNGLFSKAQQGMFDTYMVFAHHFSEARYFRGSVFRQFEGSVQATFQTTGGSLWTKVGASTLNVATLTLGFASLVTGMIGLFRDTDTMGDEERNLLTVRNVATALSLLGNLPSEATFGYRTIQSRCALFFFSSDSSALTASRSVTKTSFKGVIPNAQSMQTQIRSSVAGVADSRMVFDYSNPQHIAYVKEGWEAYGQLNQGGPQMPYGPGKAQIDRKKLEEALGTDKLIAIDQMIIDAITQQLTKTSSLSVLQTFM